MKKPTKFFILNGVRRALVLREAGRKTIIATIYREGFKPVSRRIGLSQLYSPKSEINNDARFIVIQQPILTPIEIEPLGTRAQTPSVPLSLVRLI